MGDTNRFYDVIILGSGIGGTALACILARRGIRTLVIEELSHPRFTIGESLIPETGIRLQILGEKYDVPEIAWVGSFYRLRDHVSAACGVKRSFTFCYHREGEPHRAVESNQLPTLTPPFGPDAHLFRQDTDAYLAATAVSYGAKLLQQIKVKGVELKPDEVVVETVAGDRFRGRFLIDAGGMRSHVATQLGLRDATPRFATDTRVLYTHFTGLKPYDLVAGTDHTLASPFSQATLHHVFDGGWMWIIPFNNHRDAVNPLTSVGLVLDRRKHPQPVGAPEDEFRSHVRRFPSVAKHFAGARVVRPWIGSGRIQYSSHHLIGPRFIQLPHAAAFIDPLFSSGMSVLTVAIDIMAEALLDAFAADDLSVERFQHVEDFTLQGFDHYDMVIARSFDAFFDSDLWNAWNRVWMLGNYLGTWGSLKLLLKWFETRDRTWLEKSSARGRAGVLGSHLPEVSELMRASSDDVIAARARKLSAKEASERIFKRLGALDFVPPFLGLGDPEHRTLGTFTLTGGARQTLWYGFSAPEKWRDYAAFNIFTYLREVLGFAFETVVEGNRRTRRALRDMVFAQNGDWRIKPKALAIGEVLYVAGGDDDSHDEPAAANGATANGVTAQGSTANGTVAVPPATSAVTAERPPAG